MGRIIVGIDPGSRVTGFGVVSVSGSQIEHIRHGVIRLPDKANFSTRLCALREALDEIFSAEKPVEVVVEKVFFGKNAESAFKLGQVRGVCLERIATYGADLCEYAARVVKKSVTGNGGASKEHVQMVVLNRLKISSDAEIDASDALALALCHINKSEHDRVLAKQLGGRNL